MPRAKGGPQERRKHKKVIKAAKGYQSVRSKNFRRAQESILHSGEYAFAGRSLRKRDFRAQWILTINAALKPYDLSYSKFVKLAKEKNLGLDRKILAEIAKSDETTFAKIISIIK